MNFRNMITGTLNEARSVFDKRELIAAFDNAGIEMAGALIKNAELEYAGYNSSRNAHVYFVATFDDNEQSWDVNRFEVYCGRSGEIEAEFDSMPVATDLSETEAVKLAKKMSANRP